MKIFNPTKNDITVQIMGHVYTVKAEDCLSGVKYEHAKYWKEKLHNFILVDEETPSRKTKKEVDEIIEDIITENNEEEIQEEEKEVLEDEPKVKKDKPTGGANKNK